MVVHQIINDYSQATGGAELLTRRIYLNLQARHQKCRLVGLVGESNDPLKFAETDGQTTSAPDQSKTTQFGLGSPYSIKALWKLLRYIRKEVDEGDVVHAHLSPTIFYCALAKRLKHKNFKLIVTEHNSHNNRRGTRLGRILDKLLYGSVDHIACISDGVRKALIEWMPLAENKITIIENGIELQHLQMPDRPKKGTTLQILSVGRLHKQKNIAEALRAFAEVKKQSPEFDLRYVVAGAGELENQLKSLAKELGLEKSVAFLGHVSNIPTLLKDSDIFLMPSLWEGFGLAAVEAMNAGLPVIASNVDGLREIVETSKPAGLLVDPHNSDTIADALNKLIESPELRSELGTNGFNRSKDYAEDRMFKGYEKLYKSSSKLNSAPK
ncbi:MAG: glycosyltransferase family 4 protein [Opitutaceae bacterium]